MAIPIEPLQCIAAKHSRNNTDAVNVQAANATITKSTDIEEGEQAHGRKYAGAQGLCYHVEQARPCDVH